MSKYMIPTEYGRPLGRHVNHDPASRAYAIRSAASTAVTTKRKRIIPILNQGQLGSCTGNAKTGALGSEGLYETLPAGHVPLDEAFAIKIYSLGTQLDDYDGAYPPTDTGSSGLGVSKAAQQLGLNNGYVHALSVDAMTTGLQKVAGIVGINWYDSFDNPDSTAILTLPATAKVRGGHEVHLLNVDMENERFECCNSWGPSWGLAGHMYISFTVMERLLKEDGDATFDVPLNAPAPVPSQQPYTAADLALRDALDNWGASILSKIGKAGKLNQARKTWEAAHSVS